MFKVSHVPVFLHYVVCTFISRDFVTRTMVHIEQEPAEDSSDHLDPPYHNIGTALTTILCAYDDAPEHIIRFYAIRDPADHSLATPFFSRAGAWAYQVEWSSTEDVNGWFKDMVQHGINTGNESLLDILDKVHKPLYRVLVARNARLIKQGETDIRLDPLLEGLMMVPNSIVDVGYLMKTKSRSHTTSHWMVTHLFTILQDRLHGAVSISIGRRTTLSTADPRDGVVGSQRPNPSFTSRNRAFETQKG